MSIALIHTFYESFGKGDADAMAACYHPDIRFRDPIFGDLEGDEVMSMWRMLIKRSKGKLAIKIDTVTSNNGKGSGNWTATYVFSKTGRNVVNHIHAEFEFKDGKIWRHIDQFSLWRWSRQALGLPGFLLGWTPWMRRRLQVEAKKGLDAVRKSTYINN